MTTGDTYLYILERALAIATQALELADVAERAGDPISGHNLRQMAERGRQVVKSATIRMVAATSGEGQANG